VIAAFFRYHLFPYDQSIWGQIKDPAFVVFKLLCMLPIVGVLPAMYIFVLLVIDREDEYQLIQFIMSFKGTQFFSLGVTKMIVGSVLLYLCAVDDQQDCKSMWSWDSVLEAISVLLFVIQVVTTWVAFLHIPSSKKKGSWHTLLKEEHRKKGIHLGDEFYETSIAEVRKDRYVDDERDVPKETHILMNWLIYDFVIFLLCLIALMLAMFAHTKEEARVIGGKREGGVASNWRFTLTVFLIQVFYGLMSAPFLFFQVPLVSTWFTHARPTGYTRNGHTVPYMGLPPEEAERLWLEQDRLLAEREEATASNVAAASEEAVSNRFPKEKQDAPQDATSLL